jgi:hypothetical protein
MLIRVQGHWWPGFESLIRVLLDDRDDRTKWSFLVQLFLEQDPLNIRIKVKVMTVFRRGCQTLVRSAEQRSFSG